jgi:hypothetical protein
MTSQDCESLLDTTSDIWLKNKFEQVPLTEFWCSFLQEYPVVCKFAVLKFLLFPAACMCKVEFSRYVAKKKTKYLNRLNVLSDISHVLCDKIK